jgi:hypothetical protein
MKPFESYNTNTLASFFRTVDMMARYRNTLGLLVANSLINNRTNMSTAPVLKATVRDVKKYMAMKNAASGQRMIPIGYGAQSTNDIDATVLKYMSSGDASTTIDFWAVRTSKLNLGQLSDSFYSVVTTYGQENQTCKYPATTTSYVPGIHTFPSLQTPS